MLTAFKHIGFKVFFFIFLLLTITTFVFYIITVQIVRQNILNEVIKRAESLSKSVASSTGYSFISKDVLGLDNMVYQIKNTNSDVEYIAIVDTDDTVIVHNDIRRTGELLLPSKGKLFKRSEDGTVITEAYGRSGPLFEIVTPVTFKDKPLGSVILGINRSVLLNAQQETLKSVLAVFAVTLLLGIPGSILLSHFLTRPIKELSSGVEEMKKGKSRRPLRVYSQDQLGRLTVSFNEMTSLITEQRERLNTYAHDLEEAYVATVRVLAAAIDARDPYTHGHSSRVSQLSLQLGGKIGLARNELEELEVACLFHDVGKIKIPDSILRKNDALDPSEESEMMRHAEYGADILSKAPSLHKLIPAVRHHHEWHNGSGYPDKLIGDQIPLFAAIISIADAYDALTTYRPYRDALSTAEALKELGDNSGRQFNPELLDSFIKMIEEHETSHAPESDPVIP